MTLKELYENPAAPYEEDEVTRINIDGLNQRIYERIQNWTVSDLREWLLSYEADESAIRRMSRGLTAEMIAAVCKLMTNLDLIYGAQKIRVTACCNTTVGERGIMGTRLQPCLLYTSIRYVHYLIVLGSAMWIIQECISLYEIFKERRAQKA